MTMRIAIVREAPRLFQVSTICAMIEAQVQEAAKQNADAIFWPESYLPGVTRGLVYDTIGAFGEHPEIIWWRKLLDTSITQGDKVCRFLAGLSSAYDLLLAIPVNEVRRGSLYCSIFYFAPNEGLVAAYSKLKPTAIERRIWTQGNKLVLLHTPLGIIHQCICWENMMPLSYLWGFTQGVQLHFAPTMDAGPPWPRIQSIARSGACFVITAAPETRLEYYPPDYVEYLRRRLKEIGRSEQDLSFLTTTGAGDVYCPSTDTPMPHCYASPSLTVTELNLSDLANAKFQYDVIGTDARPDIFDLWTNPSAIHIANVAPWR